MFIGSRVICVAYGHTIVVPWVAHKLYNGYCCSTRRTMIPSASVWPIAIDPDLYALEQRPLMNIDPNDLLLFARVADERSFSRAALRLGLPKSTVSRRVAGLEAQLGEPALRTTRKLAITDFGLAVLAHARHVVEDVEAADVARPESPERAERQAPCGRCASPIVLAPLLAKFVLDYAAITLEVDLAARFVDLIGENFDIALPGWHCATTRRSPPAGSRLYRRPVCGARVSGSPRNAVQPPEALMEHDTLRILARTGEPMRWMLTRGHARWGCTTGPRDRQFTGSADAHGRRRRGHHRHQ